MFPSGLSEMLMHLPKVNGYTVSALVFTICHIDMQEQPKYFMIGRENN
jgi:hypothetical protein